MVVKTEQQRMLVQCTVVGDGMVGKSCLSLAFCKSSAPTDYVATVFDNYAGRIAVNGDEYTISIFDTSGQHDYESLRELTYRDSEVYIVCFSVVDRESFESVRDFWLPEMKKYMTRKKPIILIGTQADLRNTADYDADMPVTTEEGEAMAKDIGALSYLECTASQNSSVKTVFTEVVQTALKNRKRKSNIINRLLGK